MYAITYIKFKHLAVNVSGSMLYFITLNGIPLASART